MGDTNQETTTRSWPFEEDFTPYAVEVGFLLREWNHLHETLCAIFSEIVLKNNAAQAIWHAVPVDRFQRAMLRSASIKLLNPKDPFLTELIWVLDRINEFGQQRDNVVHSPLDKPYWTI